MFGKGESPAEPLKSSARGQEKIRLVCFRKGGKGKKKERVTNGKEEDEKSSLGSQGTLGVFCGWLGGVGGGGWWCWGWVLGFGGREN